MANLNGVDMQKGLVGMNALTGSDGVSGIIIGSPAAPQLALNIVEELYNIDDVEAKGITAQFDLDNNVNVYRHLSEFYRMAGRGQKLFLILVDATATMVDILEDVDVKSAKKLLIEAKGGIKQIGVAANIAGAITSLNSIPDDVFAAIPKAQGLANWAFENNFPCQVLLEGYSFSGDAASSQDLRAIENLLAPKVSVVIGQDWDYADTLPAGNQQKLADVGTALGTLSACTIAQNIGDNEAFNLTDAIAEAWLEPGLSSHQKNDEVFAGLQTLENKGYIFGVTYTGIAGVRWNNDHTCTEIVIDAQGKINEHTIAYGRTHDKAIRLLYAALIPKVKTKQPVDPKTGKLPIGVVRNFEGIGDDVLNDMLNRKEISGGKTTVDPDSDLIVAKLLKTNFRIVPYGNINTIEGTSNLKSKL